MLMLLAHGLHPLGQAREGRAQRLHVPAVVVAQRVGGGLEERGVVSRATSRALRDAIGLRNIVDPDAGLAEMRRVTRPGGRLVVCEFSSPTWKPFRTVYLEYLMKALPRVSRAVATNPDAYVYLAESIRAWPDQAGLADRVAAAGWSRVEWQNLSGGIVALHRARA